MQAYGVYLKDHGCCPHHDKFPRDRYGKKPCQNHRRKRQQQPRKTRARMLAQSAIRFILNTIVLTGGF